MTIIQFPNRLLMIMIVAWLASHFTTGYLYAFSRAIFVTAGIIWAYEELVSGANWFRKLLGLVVLLVFFMGLVTALNHK